MLRNFKSFFESSGYFLVAIIVGVLIVLVFSSLFNVLIHVYVEYLSGILTKLNVLAFLLAIPLLLLCIFKKCRVFAGHALVFCSYVIALNIWFESLVITYTSFGLIGTVIGIVLLGVGVYFTGLAGLLWMHMFANFGLFALAIVLMLLIRYAGKTITEKELIRRADEEITESLI